MAGVDVHSDMDACRGASDEMILSSVPASSKQNFLGCSRTRGIEMCGGIEPVQLEMGTDERERFNFLQQVVTPASAGVAGHSKLKFLYRLDFVA